jgi:hypothetical protein
VFVPAGLNRIPGDRGTDDSVFSGLGMLLQASTRIAAVTGARAALVRLLKPGRQVRLGVYYDGGYLAKGRASVDQHGAVGCWRVPPFFADRRARYSPPSVKRAEAPSGRMSSRAIRSVGGSS